MHSRDTDGWHSGNTCKTGVWLLITCTGWVSGDQSLSAGPEGGAVSFPHCNNIHVVHSEKKRMGSIEYVKSFIVLLCDLSTYIPWDCFFGTGVIVRDTCQISR